MAFKSSSPACLPHGGPGICTKSSLYPLTCRIMSTRGCRREGLLQVCKSALWRKRRERGSRCFAYTWRGEQHILQLVWPACYSGDLHNSSLAFQSFMVSLNGHSHRSERNDAKLILVLACCIEDLRNSATHSKSLKATFDAISFMLFLLEQTHFRFA